MNFYCKDIITPLENVDARVYLGSLTIHNWRRRTGGCHRETSQERLRAEDTTLLLNHFCSGDA